MTKPRRIQRKRTKGWRKPPGAVYVGRPSQWGNPYGNNPFSVAFDLCDGNPIGTQAVKEYRGILDGRPNLVKLAKKELKGKDLLCWCALDQPCHADVLLEISNEDG